MSDKLKQKIGLDEGAGSESNRKQLISYINLKLSTLDLPIYEKAETKELDITIDLIKNIRERNRIMHDYLCPADKRIQDFLNRYLSDACPNGVPTLPNDTFVLDLIEGADIGRTLLIEESIQKINQKIIEGSHEIELVFDYSNPEITNDMTGEELGITGWITAEGILKKVANEI